MAISISKATIVSSSDTGNPVPIEDTTIGNYTQPSAAVSSTDFGSDLVFDFSSATGWTEGGTPDIDVETVTNQRMDFVGGYAGTTEITYYDIGAGNLSSSSWEARFKIRWSGIADGGNAKPLYVLMSDSTADGGTAQDYIGFMLIALTGQFSNQMTFVGIDGDGEDFKRWNEGDGNSTTAYATATDYYVSIKRLTTTTYSITIRTGSHSGTIQDTISGTCASTTDALRYFKVAQDERGFVENGTNTGFIDDLEIQYSGTAVDELPAANAIDDNTGVNWTSRSEVNPNIYVDCDGVGNVNLIGCAVWFNSDTTETECRIQVSTDASSWTNVNLISSISVGAWTFFRFNAQTARYIRIYGNSGNSLVLSIAEIKYKADASFPVVHLHKDVDATIAGDGVYT